mgnify:CR=1 FL=1
MLNSNLTELTANKLLSDGTKPTLEHGTHHGNGCYYFKVGCFVCIYIDVEFSSAPTNESLFVLPAGYRPPTKMELAVSGGGSYNAKAQCVVGAGGGVSVTSVDKYVQGGGMFIV